MAEVVVEVQLRDRNQITMPAEAVEGLAVRPGARLLLRIDPVRHVGTVRPLRESYAGVAGTIYGRTAGQAATYVKRERAAWSE